MAGRRITIASGVVGVLALIVAGALAWAWPRFFSSPMDRGRIAYERRDWASASSRALEVLKHAPNDQEALRLLARSSSRLGRDETSSSIYKRLGFDGLTPEDYLVIAAGFHRQGDLNTAFRLLEKGHELDPDHAGLLHDLARFCASRDQLSRAEDLATRLARQTGQEPRAGVLLAAIRDRLSDPQGASEALEKALRLDPSLKDLDRSPLEARKLLARDYLRLGQPAPALEELRLVLKAGPDPEASWLQSRAWLQEGQGMSADSALRWAGRYGTDRPMAPEPSPFAGSVECAVCHEAIYKAQQSSRHARTFGTGPGLARLSLPTARMPDPTVSTRVVHDARLEGKRVIWETRLGETSARAILEYAFGSGDRGVTPIGRGSGGRLLEMRLSRYGDINAWDLTAGHQGRPGPTTAEEALGAALDPDELRKCLGCHTTDFRASRDHMGPTSAESGIGCERCHGPGANHLKAVSLGFSDPAIARPKHATPAEVTRLCAECHSPIGRSVQPTDPDAVRFQGTTLAWSRCYQESGGRMSCVTCHDPHHDASTSASSYEAKCLTCHAPSQSPGSRNPGDPPILAEGGRGAACPVNPSGDCVRCHMPPTQSAVPHTTFSDHQIRVHRPAKPSR